MAYQQAEVNGQQHRNGQQTRTSPVSGVASQAANVLGDMLELAELQAKLAKADTLSASKAATQPTGLLIVGACGALASLPIVLLGIASMVDALTVLNAWQSQLLVGLLAATLAIIVVFVAVRQLRRLTLQFKRTAEVLAKNIAWAKVVVRSGNRH